VAPIFLEITIIIVLAAFLTSVFRFLKQPAILAYILTGIIIGPLGFLNIRNPDFIQTLAQLGITFLLFTLGLEIRIKDFTSISKVALIVSAVQISFSFLAGYIISLLFGLNAQSAIYIGIAVTFSSTVIVIKLISEKRELHSLHGKIAIGVLLIQDFLAIAILIFLSGFNPQLVIVEPFAKFAQIAIKGAILFGAVWYLGSNVFPKLVEKLARSTETLFLASIAWVFGLAALVSSVGFSVEIGGFLAGLALANSIANYQIIARARILQDFFIILFFVLLGIQMAFGNILSVLAIAIVLSAIVLIVKPFIVMIIMGILGFKKRTSFLTGVSLGQVSEFQLDSSDRCDTGLVCSAEEGVCVNDFGQGAIPADKLGEAASDIRDQIRNIINIALGFLGVIGVIIVIYGGIVWMTAAGDDEKVGKAKKTIIAGVIGIIIIGIAWTIVSYVLNLAQQIS